MQIPGSAKKGGANSGGLDDELDIGVMRSGDYMIHVYLQTGKNFKPEEAGETTGFLLQKFSGKEEQSSSVFDPMVQIQCGDETRHSSCKAKSPVNDDTALYWGEHFFFEPRSLTQEDIQSRKVTLRVLDKGFFKNRQVGEFEFDVAQIYFMNEEHAIQHQWIALVNPTAVKNNQVKGYLKVSIAIQGPGDSSLKLSDPVGASSEADQDILMPPQIRKKYKQVDLTFLEGQKFPKMDTLGWVDPIIEINDGLLRSPKAFKYSKEREGCEFNQVFKIPIAWPVSNDKLKITIKDKDLKGEDVLGSIVLSYKDIVRNCSSPGVLAWKNIYGAPLGLVEGPGKRLMNNNPNLGSTWKGRVLMNIEVKDTKAPEKGVFDYTEPTIPLQLYKQATKMKKYELLVEVGQGICLPQTKQYKVRIAIADFHVDTDAPKQTKKNYCRWSQRIELTNQQILFPYDSIEQMDQVYFYLMDDNKPICFWKGKIADFMSRNPSFQWYALKVDKVFGNVKNEHEAGLLQVKLSINDLEKELPVNWKQYSAWKSSPPKRLTPCTVRCYIYQCRGLPSGDVDGTSDPYVQVHGLLEKGEDTRRTTTQTVPDNLNPIFYETIDISFAYQEKESPPPIVMDIYDSDAGEGLIAGVMDGSDDFLSRAIIHLKDASVADYRKSEDDKYLNTPPKPKWHKLRAGNFSSLPECGEILCSFSLVPADYVFKQPLDQITFVSKNKIQEYTVDIHCLGLRNLQSFGILPIRKAFIKFNIRSMLPPRKSLAVKNIRSEPKESGASPNINTCIQFSAELPNDPLFCPSLACDVFDQICRGVSQPKIGSFSIPVGELMQEQAQNRIKMRESADNIIRALAQAFQNAKEQKRQSIGQNFQQVSTRKADHALKKLQKNYAQAFGLQEIESEFAQRAGSLEGQIESTNEKQKLAIEMLQKEKERKQSQQKPPAELSPKPPVRQIPSDSNMQGSLNISDTLRNQTDTMARSGAYESTVIIKESDYGDEESHSLMDRQALPSQGEPPRSSHLSLDTGRLRKLMSEDDHDALLLGLIQHSQPPKMLKDAAQQEQAQIKAQFQQIKENNLQAVDRFHKSLADLRKRRQEMVLKGAQAEVQFADQNNKMKMLQQVEQSLLTHIKNSVAEMKLLQKQTILREKKDDMIKMMQDGKDVHSNIIMPEYERDERLKVYREKNKPPSSLYYEVGYDGPITSTEPKVQNKHYRKYYLDELENNKQIFFRQPFITCEIKRGQSRGLHTSLWDVLLGLNTDESGFKSNEQVVGTFKGHIHVHNQKSDEEYEINKAKSMKKIQDHISAISEVKNEKPFPFDIFNLETAEDRDKMKQELINMDIYTEDLDRFLMDQNYQKILTNQLQNQQNCMVYLYMLEGFDFASRDIGSFSDPFLKIRLGKQVINKQDDYQLDEPNPKFHQVFEFNTKFPGSAPLEIEAWDYDDLFGDDLIGKSIIDLDDRFFSPEWRAIENKPIEYRELYHPSTSLAQGTVLCWLDICEQSKSRQGAAGQQKVWDIQPEPKKDYQLRLSVFGTQNVPMEDVEGTSDVFVKAFINENDKKETDTHWRCTDGQASFNYRMLFDFQSPSYQRSDKESYKLKIQIYDRDVFKSNDFICQFTLDLYLMVLDCRATQKLIHLNKKYYESFFKREYNKEIERSFVPGVDGGQQAPELLDLKFEDDDSFWLSIKPKGDAEPVRIRIDVRVLSGEDAGAQRVGDARSEPNHSPFLPAPIGRIGFSLNPFAMIGQFFGPDVRRMLLKYFLMLSCLAILIFLAPMIVSDLAAASVIAVVQGTLSGVWGTVKAIF